MYPLGLRKKKFGKLLKRRHFKKLNEAAQILAGKQKAEDQQHPGFSGVDLGDLFGGRMPDFSRFDFDFSSYMNRPIQHFPEHDREIQINFSMTVDDIKRGRSMRAQFNKSKQCDDCSGLGGKERKKCTPCNGTGQFRQEHRENGSHWMNVGRCSTCHGSGAQLVDPCKKCEGSGQVVFQEQIVFEVKEKK